MARYLTTLGASVSGTSVSLSGQIGWDAGDTTTVTGVQFRIFSNTTGTLLTSSASETHPGPNADVERYKSVSRSYSGLTRGVEYSYRLISSNSGEAGSAGTFYIKNTQTAPSAPSLSSRTSSSITLSNQGSDIEYRRGLGSWQSSTFFGGLSSNTAYDFYARKKETSTLEASPASSATGIVTLRTAPSTPSASNLTSNSVTLSSSSGSVIVANGETKSTGSSWTGLSPSTQYTAYAYYPASGSILASEPSSELTFTTLAAATPPSTPTGLSTTNNNNSVSVSWNGSSGATGYVLYRDGTSVGNIIYDGSGTSYNDTGADAPSISASMSASTDNSSQINVTISASTSSGTLHTYYVRAYNTSGNSNISSGVTGRRVAGSLSYQINGGNSSDPATHSALAFSSSYNDTSNPPSGSAPTSVIVDNATTTSLRISWSGAQAYNGATRYYSSIVSAAGCSNKTPTANGYRLGSIAGYETFRSTVSGSLGTSIGSGSSPKIDSGLTAATIYYYTVRVFISSIVTTYNSAQVSGTTLSARPANYAWTTAKVSGQNFVVTGTEWNGLTTRINQFRAYVTPPLSPASFTTVATGNNFTATIFNQARNAISGMSPPTAPPATVSTGNDVLASQLNGLVSSLNSIV